MSSETIDERDDLLTIDMKHIDKDVIFPVGFYYYPNKKHRPEKNDSSLFMDSKPVLDITLSGVGYVLFPENCSTSYNFKLLVVSAEKVTIDKNAIMVASNRDSGLRLNYVGEVVLHDSWGTYLFLEFCKNVYVHSFGLASSVHHIHFSNISVLMTDDDFIQSVNVSILTFSSISRWSLKSSIDFVPKPLKSLDYHISNITIRNTSIYMEPMEIFHLAASSVTLDSIKFTFSTFQPFSDSDDFPLPLPSLTPEKILVYNQTFFLAKHFDLGNNTENNTLQFHLCLYNETVGCLKNSSCLHGVPYPFNENQFKDLDCYIIHNLGKKVKATKF